MTEQKPVAVTAAESIEKLRTWASGRCLDATRGGIYVRPQRKSKTRQVEKGVIRLRDADSERFWYCRVHGLRQDRKADEQAEEKKRTHR